jgi:hypothetical protein
MRIVKNVALIDSISVSRQATIAATHLWGPYADFDNLKIDMLCTAVSVYHVEL